MTALRIVPEGGSLLKVIGILLSNLYELLFVDKSGCTISKKDLIAEKIANENYVYSQKR